MNNSSEIFASSIIFEDNSQLVPEEAKNTNHKPVNSLNSSAMNNSSEIFATSSGSARGKIQLKQFNKIIDKKVPEEADNTSHNNSVTSSAMNTSQELFAECSTFKTPSKRRNRKKRSVEVVVEVIVEAPQAQSSNTIKLIDSKSLKKETPTAISTGRTGYVTTKKNNGSERKLSNQCFWISVRDFLQSVKRQNITVSQMRETIQTKISDRNNYYERISKKFKNIKECLSTKRSKEDINGKNNAKLNGPKNMFDYIEHGASAEALAEHYDISINVYCVRDDTLLTQEPIFIFGTGSSVVNVAYYGDHFEWIRSFTRDES